MNELAEDPRPEAARPAVWGFWASTWLTILVVLVCIVAVIAFGVAMAVYGIMTGTLSDAEEFALSLDSSGLFFAISVIGQGVIGIPLVLLFIRLRRGLPASQYLAWTPAGRRSFVTWMSLTAVLILASDAMSWLSDRPIVPEVMQEIYRSATVAPLLWVAFVLVAPPFEEMLFRGFLLEGLRHSAVGPRGAILLTSLAWTLLHVQYGAYELVQIFVLGLFLGYARLSTGSLKVPLAMHVFINLVATAEVAIGTAMH